MHSLHHILSDPYWHWVFLHQDWCSHSATLLPSLPSYHPPPPTNLTYILPTHVLTASHSIWSILTLSIPPPGLMKSLSFPPASNKTNCTNWIRLMSGRDDLNLRAFTNSRITPLEINCFSRSCEQDKKTNKMGNKHWHHLGYMKCFFFHLTDTN